LLVPLTVAMPAPPPPGLTAKEKRAYMASIFEKSQRAMAMAVDDVMLAKRSAVPYPSTFTGKSVSDTGPIPTDAHLIPSGFTVVKSDPGDFEVADGDHEQLGLGGKPWASYTLTQPSVYARKLPDGAYAARKPERTRTVAEEEMWRARYGEWTLQKNAFNPDIAAALRTNVRKQANLSIPALDKPQDPARTSENVRAALSHSEITGPVLLPPKAKIDPSVYNPDPMS